VTAWANLLLKSTAAIGSTAWQHLISPFAGGGGGDCDPDAGWLLVTTTEGYALAAETPAALLVPEPAGVVVEAEAAGLVLLV
jgi:hypothetical protein